MVVIEEGISTRSFVISMVATVSGLASLVWFLQLTKGASLWVNLVCVAITLTLLGIGMAAWMGKFEKKQPIKRPELPYEPRYDAPFAEDEVKAAPVPKEDWASKWLKENN